MSTQIKCIIPFIDDEFKKDYLSEDFGFVDAYLYDQNRPSLEDCVFLLYDFDKLCANFNIRYKLSHAKLLRSYKVIYINKKAYYLFTYQLFESSVRHIFDGNIPKNNNAAKILKFWNFSDEVLTDKLLNSKVQLLNRDISSVPEEDYLSSIDDARLIYKNRVMIA